MLDILRNKQATLQDINLTLMVKHLNSKTKSYSHELYVNHTLLTKITQMIEQQTNQ